MPCVARLKGQTKVGSCYGWVVSSISKIKSHWHIKHAPFLPSSSLQAWFILTLHFENSFVPMFDKV